VFEYGSSHAKIDPASQGIVIIMRDGRTSSITGAYTQPETGGSGTSTLGSYGKRSHLTPRRSAAKNNREQVWRLGDSESRWWEHYPLILHSSFS